MATLLAFIVINFIAVINCQAKEISGLVYSLYQVEYDSNFKRFELIHRPNCDCDRLYEILNSENKYRLHAEFSHIWKILINKQNDVFVFASDQNEHKEGKQTVWLLSHKDYDHINSLFTFNSKGKYNDPSYFIDQDDIIYFNTQRGVAALKPKKTQPVWIENLKDFKFHQHTEDTKGNVYLSNKFKNSVAVITKESKRWSILTGKFSSVKNYKDIKGNLNKKDKKKIEKDEINFQDNNPSSGESKKKNSLERSKVINRGRGRGKSSGRGRGSGSGRGGGSVSGRGGSVSGRGGGSVSGRGSVGVGGRGSVGVGGTSSGGSRGRR